MVVPAPNFESWESSTRQATSFKNPDKVSGFIKSLTALFAEKRWFVLTYSSQVVLEVEIAFEAVLAFVALERPL